MAKNWLASDIANAIKDNDMATLKTLGNKYPLAVVALNGATPMILDIFGGMPEWMTARKFNKIVEAALIDGETAEDEDEADEEAEAPKKDKAAAKGKGKKKAKPEPELEDEDEDEDDDDEEEDEPAPKKKGR